MANFIAGPYSWTVKKGAAAAVPLGVTDDAVQVTEVTSAELITGDNLGDTIQDALNRGGNILISMTLQEASSAGLELLFKSHQLASDTVSRWTLLNLGTIGCPLSPNALVLTATPINSCSQFSAIIFHAVIIAPGFDVRRIFGSRLSNVPLQFLCLPVEGVNGAPPFLATFTPQS